MKTTKRILTTLAAASFLIALGAAQAQPGRSQTSGSCCYTPNYSTATPTQSLSDVEKVALERALQDEYKARATYHKILAVFGEVRPFANIVHAESRHADMLVQLFERYGLPVPVDTWADKVPAYGTLLEAAEASVEAEIENGALYDDLMRDVKNTEVRAVFDALHFATMEHHLPAFQRFVAMQTGAAPDRGYGRGQGMGPKNGQGRGYGRGQGMGPGNGQGRGFGRGQGMGPRNGQGRGFGRGQCGTCPRGFTPGAGRGNGRGMGRGQGTGWYNQGATL